MKSEPTTECGIRLCNILKSWVIKSPGAARDALHRIFILYSSRIDNQEHFLDALYGQAVLDEEQYWELMRKPKDESYPHYKAQEAICACMKNNSARLNELVLALEWSKNETVLENILKWAEDKGFGRKDWLDSPDYFIQ